MAADEKKKGRRKGGDHNRGLVKERKEGKGKRNIQGRSWKREEDDEKYISETHVAYIASIQGTFNINTHHLNYNILNHQSPEGRFTINSEIVGRQF